jgi:rhodanese-related sulfurtransferase
MPGLSEVSPSQLIRLLGTPDAPLLVDVRLPEDVAADPFVLPSARSCAHDEVAALSSWIGARSAVLVCQRGRKLSHGAAALLRSLGHRAEVLEAELWPGRRRDCPASPSPSRRPPAASG